MLWTGGPLFRPWPGGGCPGPGQGGGSRVCPGRVCRASREGAGKALGPFDIGQLWVVWFVEATVLLLIEGKFEGGSYDLQWYFKMGGRNIRCYRILIDFHANFAHFGLNLASNIRKQQ